MSISKKIFSAFLILALAAVGAFLSGWRSAVVLHTGLEEVDSLSMPLSQNILEVRSWLERKRMHNRTLMAPGLTLQERRDQITRRTDVQQNYLKAMAAVEQLFAEARAGNGFAAPETENAWRNLQKNIAAWDSGADEVNKNLAEWDKTFIFAPDTLKADLQSFRGDHLALIGRLGAMLANRRVSGPAVDNSDSACAFGQWRANFDESLRLYRQSGDANKPIILSDGTPGIEYVKNETIVREMEAVTPDHAAFHQIAHEVYGLLAAGRFDEAVLKYQELFDAADKVISRFAAIISEADAASLKVRETQVLLMGSVLDTQNTALEVFDQVIQTNERESDARIVSAIAKGDFNIHLAILIAVVGIGLASVLAYFIVSRIIRGLRHVISELGEAAFEVTAAANDITGSAQHLADGATKQAAALEETAATLEEMSNMARQNAENSTRTNETTGQTVQLISEGAAAVTNMSQAMGDISDSAEKIGRIIKTIEEIAFQTNLLALNAAVEAARAGESGKGFAVVADEVRNLAQRSAQAARDTAELIESTVTRVQHGSEIAVDLDSSFKKIETVSKDVSDLIVDISTASHEQAKEVDQLNSAVGQMDQVTQSNAASAEQCASTAEELSSQATHLKGMVDELVGVVTGKVSHSAAAAPPPRPPQKSKPPTGRTAASTPQQLAAPQKAATKSNGDIPMDDDKNDNDFTGF